MEELMNLLIKYLEKGGYQISDSFFEDDFGLVDLLGNKLNIAPESIVKTFYFL